MHGWSIHIITWIITSTLMPQVLAPAVQIALTLQAEDETAREGFMDFLKTGNSEYPVESLKKAGVDMTSPLPYESVALRMNELLDEMEKLISTMN